MQTQMKNINLADDNTKDCVLNQVAVQELKIQNKFSIVENGITLMTTLKKTISLPPDVIFLDRNTPRKNQYEALTEIRNTPKLKGIPIVIFSTTASDDALNKTYEHCEDYYFCKPSSFSLSVKVIETILAIKIRQTPQTFEEKYLLN